MSDASIPRARRIFMSYSRRDALQVDRIAAALEREGHDVWIDRADITGGAEWQEHIVRAIKQIDVFVIALSPDSVASPEVRRELAIADRERKPVIPVALRPVDVPDTLEYSLVNLQRIDLSGDFEVGIRRLGQAIDALGRVDTAPGSAQTSAQRATGSRGNRRASARTAALCWAVGGLLAALAGGLVAPAGAVPLLAVTVAITGAFGALFGALVHRCMMETAAVVVLPIFAMILLAGILIATTWLALGLAPTRPAVAITYLLAPLLGAAMWIAQKFWLMRRETERLKASGTALATHYVEVVKNPALSFNGRHPFRIVTEWRDPVSHDVRLFYGQNLWFDPTRHVELSTITVFVDERDPSNYYMDLSFLPKVR